MSKKPVAYWDPGDIGPVLYDKETDEELGGISEARSHAEYNAWNAMFFSTRAARKQGYKSVTVLCTSPGKACELVNRLAEEAGYTVSKVCF